MAYIVKEDFPVGMRVLAVDNDRTSLLMLERLLQHCRYAVTTASYAEAAMQLIRGNEEQFDLLIINIDMPESGGFRLLEHVDQETDTPAVVVSASDDEETVRKAVLKGARGFLVKPIRIEELKTIWQHAVRNKIFDILPRTDGGGNAGKLEESHAGMEPPGIPNDSSKDQAEHSDYSSAEPSPKKRRFAWTKELHDKFLDAINALGPERAVPKRIMEVMNVKGLSRQHVTSHLQTYRMNMRKQNIDDGECSQLAPNCEESPLTFPGPRIVKTHSSLVGSSSPRQDHVDQMPQPSQIGNINTCSNGSGPSNLNQIDEVSNKKHSGVTVTMIKDIRSQLDKNPSGCKSPCSHEQSKLGERGTSSTVNTNNVTKSSSNVRAQSTGAPLLAQHE